MVTFYQRHKPVLNVAGLLLAIVVLGNFVIWLARHHSKTQDLANYLTAAAVAVTMVVVAFRWSARWPSGTALPRAFVALLLGAVLGAVISPFAAGQYPFHNGAGNFFNVIWLMAGSELVGAVLGVVFAIAVGKDYRTVALRNYEASKAGKPRRV
jgi:hypothetical protein